MKALFASFGRKSAVHNTNNDSQPSSSKHRKVTQQNGNGLNSEKSFPAVRSFGGVGDSIGAAPVKAHQNHSSLRDNSLGHSFSKNADWGFRLTGTFRGSSRRKRDKESSSTGNGGSILEATIAAQNHSNVAHPPSSYRDPGIPRSTSPGFQAMGASSTHLSLPADNPNSKPTSRSNSLRIKPSLSLTGSVHERTPRPDAKYPPFASRSSYISRSGKENDGESDHQGRRSTNLKRHSPGLGNVQSARSSEGNTGVHSSKRMSMTLEDLATKLSELAVANGDGLLSDEEYRILRQGLFEKMMQLDVEAMQVPQEPNLEGLGAASSAARSVNGHASAEDQAVIPDSKSLIGQGEGRSIHCNSNHNSRNSALGNVSSFFKRGGVGTGSMKKQLSGDSGSGLDDPETSMSKPKVRRRGSVSASSLLSSGDSHSLRPPSSMTHYSNAARSSRASTTSRLRTGSMGRRLQAESLADDMERNYSQARSARSLRATSIHEANFTAPEEYGDAEKSSAGMRAEIAVVQAEGARLLDTFKGMEHTVIAKYKLEPSVLKKAVEEVKQSRNAPPSSYRPPRGHEDEVENLKRELTELSEKREAVVKRYEERLALLRSKLRSATIKEGLTK